MQNIENHPLYQNDPVDHAFEQQWQYTSGNLRNVFLAGWLAGIYNIRTDCTDDVFNLGWHCGRSHAEEIED